jgi:hypothetical protein
MQPDQNEALGQLRRFNNLERIRDGWFVASIAATGRKTGLRVIHVAGPDCSALVDPVAIATHPAIAQRSSAAVRLGACCVSTVRLGLVRRAHWGSAWR